MENSLSPVQPQPETILSTPPESPIPPAGNSKIVILVVIVGVIALIGIAFFLLRLYRPVSNSISVPTNEIADTTPTAIAPRTMDTTNWATYTDKAAGFSFKYPPESVLVNTDTEGAEVLSLSVAAEKLADIPETLPMFMGRDDALAEKALLVSGDGENFVKIGSLYGNVSSTFSLYEVCSVMFVRRLKFYPGEYRVTLTLFGPNGTIMADMPDFFTVDPTNCGERNMWKRDDEQDFEQTLKNRQGAGMAQEWYNTFDAIVGTVQLITPTATLPTPKPSPVAVSGTTYTNETYGFELTYDAPYKLLTSKDDLYGYPHGVALLYTGGQAYNIVIETWNTEAEYKNEYGPRISDLTVFYHKGKYITVLNNTASPENQKIIDSMKILAN